MPLTASLLSLTETCLFDSARKTFANPLKCVVVWSFYEFVHWLLCSWKYPSVGAGRCLLRTQG